jgi:hypothetical protein
MEAGLHALEKKSIVSAEDRKRIPILRNPCVIHCIVEQFRLLNMSGK